MNSFMLLMPKPARIFKYEAFTARSIQNLKEQIIYFGSPQNFNDPYDCAIPANIKEPTDQDVDRIRSHYLAKSTLDQSQKKQFETLILSELRKQFTTAGKGAVEEIHAFLKTKGISCFSDRNDSLLMWSHYGGYGKGFCLEFDTAFPEFKNLRMVSYTNDMPQIDIVPILCDNNHEQVEQLYCTKAKDWEYEQEWRCIHQKAGTAYHYPTEALTGIYFGPDIEFSSFEIICLILNGQNEKIKKWMGCRCKSTFSVDFTEVNYMSHLEAKHKGSL